MGQSVYPAPATGGEFAPYAKTSTPSFSVVTGSNLRGYANIDTSSLSTSKYYTLRSSNAATTPGCLIGGTNITTRYSTGPNSHAAASVPFKPTSTSNSMIYAASFPTNNGNNTQPGSAMYSCFTDGTYFHIISGVGNIMYRTTLAAFTATTASWSTITLNTAGASGTPYDGVYEATSPTNKYVVVCDGTKIVGSADGV